MFQNEMDHIDSAQNNREGADIPHEDSPLTSNGNKTLFNKPMADNEKAVTKSKLWDGQPTSKIYNAQAISENEVSGINRLVKLEIFVEGKEIRFFKHFKLSQSATRHHTFELTLAHDTFGEAENHNLEDAQALLGKRITIVFRYKDVEEGPERNFIGVITEVGFSQEQGSLGNIVLIGESPTVLLDAAPHTQSFGGGQEISLNSIASKVMSEGLDRSKFDFRVDSTFGNVSYGCQYEETHYNYLARIAEAYGEQFFYDGEVLHFGKLPPAENVVKLIYGRNLSDVRIRMRAQHVKPSFYGYNSRKNEKLTGGNPPIKHVSDIAQRAYDISANIFKTPSLRVAPIKANSFLDVEASQKGTAGSKASEVFITSGVSTVPFLYPGCVVDLEMRKTDSNQTSYFTRLMMIEVMHQVDARGHYYGSFEAIAADSGFIPRPEFEIPKAEPQLGKVIANNDPLGQGRVKVQFDWQHGQDSTEFIRVMSPDAGSSEKVNKNRGFMSVPEVGDQVILNFVHSHPDRPFVMGGMFHGASGAGGGEANNVMSFSGRSGAELRYDNGAGSMNLKDQGGANIFFDGSGNAVVNANTDHTTNTGSNNTINAGSSTTINVGGKKGESPQSFLKMDSAGNVVIDAKTSITLKVGENLLSIDKKGLIKLNGKNLEQKADNNFEVNAKRVNQTAKGANFKINSDQNVIVTGGNEVKMK
ncbi:phage baseplate assembly protein V [Sphingobacterium sp. 40-24]|uniref:type VI secretion system Vgr family protein n=1 Tax=Sphingobacterium sp. 40-24 TaxID=1895843 RepID=UPI00095C46D8|nr:phage baseplate assembly protein V [Sphingobacterium sp. 40-24]OJZ01255.1 MAG: Vgr family protein [Sphingobacterium sp. 40-24]